MILATVVSRWWIPKSSTPSTRTPLPLAFYCKQKPSLPFYLFIYLFVISTESWISIFPSGLKFIPVFTLVFQLFQIWPVGAPSCWPCVLVTCPHHIFWVLHSLLAEQDGPGSLVPILLQPWNWLFLQRGWVPFSGEWYQGPRSRSGCVHSYWGFLVFSREC